MLFIAGAQKCGTTTLWHNLRKHPDVRIARDPETGEAIKELGFFAGRREIRSVDSIEEQRARFEEYFPGDKGLRMDATPKYLTALRRHALMAEAYPDARVVISLRNPVERAYSQYNHYMQQLPATAGWDWRVPGESFDQNVDAELRDYDPEKPSVTGIVGKGRYVLQLRSILKHYPREQVKVVILERWSQEHRRLLGELQDELGLGYRKLPIRISHRREKTVEPMGDETRSRLVDHFRSYCEELEELLGEAIPEWV